MAFTCAYDAKFISNMINEMPVGVDPLADLDLFEFKGTPTRDAWIKVSGMDRCLVPSSKWCCPSDVQHVKATDEFVFGPINVPHTVLKDQIMACDIAGNVELAVGFAQTGLMDLTDILPKRVMTMRDSIEWTLAYRKWMAVTRGIVLDADASTVMLDLFAKFGVTQNTLPLDLQANNSAPTYLHGWVSELLKKMVYAAKGAPVIGAKVFLSSADFDKLVALPGYVELWKRCCDLSAAVQGAAIGNGLARRFQVGAVEFREVWQPEVCNPFDAANPISFIAEGVAHAIPIMAQGVEMYELLAASPMTLATVNQAPTQLYFYRDWDIEDQSRQVVGRGSQVEMNAIPIVKRPATLINVPITV
jgi:hypothetical protein